MRDRSTRIREWSPIRACTFRHWFCSPSTSCAIFAFSARDSTFRALHVFKEEPVSLLVRQSKLFHVSMWRVDICWTLNVYMDAPLTEVFARVPEPSAKVRVSNSTVSHIKWFKFDSVKYANLFCFKSSSKALWIYFLRFTSVKSVMLFKSSQPRCHRDRGVRAVNIVLLFLLSSKICCRCIDVELLLSVYLLCVLARHSAVSQKRSFGNGLTLLTLGMKIVTCFSSS